MKTKVQVKDLRADIKFLTKEQLKKYFDWSESTFQRRKSEGVITEFKIGDSKAYYDPRQVEDQFRPVKLKRK